MTKVYFSFLSLVLSSSFFAFSVRLSFCDYCLFIGWRQQCTLSDASGHLFLLLPLGEATVPEEDEVEHKGYKRWQKLIVYVSNAFVWGYAS